MKKLFTLKNYVLLCQLTTGIVAAGLIAQAISPTYFCQDSLLINCWRIGSVMSIGLLLWVMTMVFPKQFLRQIEQIKRKADELAKGQFSPPLPLAAENELTQIIASLNQTAEALKKAATFAQQMGEGQLATHFQPASQEDTLGYQLLDIRKQMFQVSQESQQRSWANEGLAKFAEIAQSTGEIKALAERVIGECVRYLGANQGGIFVLKDDQADDIHLELLACYAYERNKHQRKRVEIGEGLLGQAYIERDTIFLTDIPTNYLHITSGLGGTAPSCVLIVPLLLNDHVEGVLELASFKAFQPEQVAFVEKMAQNIATVFSKVKINERTRQLLNESQEHTEKLRIQEEAMRQNIEELSAIQDEMTRKQVELTGQINALNNAAIVSEVDLQGNIIFANDEFCQVSGYVREELIGKKHSIVRHPDMPAAAFEELWATITKGKVWKGEVKNRRKDGSHYWVAATITPVLGTNGKPIKYIGVRFEITSIKDQEENLLQQAKMLVAN